MASLKPESLLNSDHIMPSQTCLLLVFGIPATGKSSLVKELLSRTDSWPATGAQCVHVCFDDFYPSDNRESQMSPVDLESPFNWKHQRSLINSNIEKWLTINSSHCELDTVQDEKWKEFMEKLCTRNNDSRCKRIQSNGKFMCDRTVIIIDDNLPLRSMRYEYYQMARKYSCGFCEVLLSCELSTALSCNQERSQPIPSNTITTMASILEPSQPMKHHWEEKSLVMETDKWWDGEDKWSSICCRIYELCERAMQDPVNPFPVEDPLIKEECRLITMNNLTHQVDQKLRECVSSVITKCKDSKSPEVYDIAQEAKFANILRKQILEEFRSSKPAASVFQSVNQYTSQQANVTDIIKSIERRFYLLYSNKPLRI